MINSTLRTGRNTHEPLFYQNPRFAGAVHPGEQLKIADIVKLNANENPYPPAPGVAAAVAAAVPGLRLYSDLTNGDLNAAIARHWGVRPENILCGNGSDENLLLALRAFCDESTPLAFADVTYSFYTVLCDLLHILQHIIPLEADLTIDLKNTAACTRRLSLPTRTRPPACWPRWTPSRRCCKRTPTTL